MKRTSKTIIIISAVIIVITVWIVWGNTALVVDEFSITSDRIPQSFSGYRIVQVSDLHNAEFGKNNENLIKKIGEVQPDIIVITGDLVDSNHTDLDVGIAFAEKAMEIAPCYYVTGNHEARIHENEREQLLEGLRNAGVVILQNESVSLQNNAESITLIGIDDPNLQSDYSGGNSSSVVVSSVLETLMAETSGYTVLLSHRPELFESYVSHNADLVLTGHAHGGQFRLPFIGGVIAPNQGLFPKYDAGLYSENATNMIVSRGLGNSIIPVRVNNRPEIVVVELTR